MSTLHLRFHGKGHSRVSEIILAGRTGYWPVDPDRAKSCDEAALWEMHPNGGDMELNDTANGPYVAYAKLTAVYHIKWVDKTRAIIEFDPRTLRCERVSPSVSPPKFNTGGICYEDA